MMFLSCFTECMDVVTSYFALFETAFITKNLIIKTGFCWDRILRRAGSDGKIQIVIMY